MPAEELAYQTIYFVRHHLEDQIPGIEQLNG